MGHEWLNALVSSIPKRPIQNKGILSGFSVAVKDNIATLESTTTCSSTILKGTISVVLILLTGYQSPFEATGIQKALHKT
jgi:aspartyl-tRNA(Asn)/glutamyl-tRNA(Gln) amidotransferase subunit A